MSCNRGKAARRAAAIAVAVAGTATGLTGCGGGAVGTVPTVNFYIGTENSGSYAHAVSTCNARAAGAYRIAWTQLPSAADNQRQQLVLRSAAKDSTLDVLGLDVTWAAEFAAAGWILPWQGADAAAVTTGTLPGPLATATYKGTLYGAPFNSNTQLLWYRKDLVPTPPATWQEMLADSARLAKAGKPHYVEEQGAQYEGLTVWFNSLVDSAGGTILSGDGSRVTLGDPARLAATALHDLATGPAGDPSLAVQKEDDGRLAFEGGQTAAFQINYPFIYASAVSDKAAILPDIGWAPFPSLVPGQPGRSTIGGYNLAVSAYSPHRGLAFAAAACLRSSENQIFDAVKGGLPPTLAGLYSDASVRASYPFADLILTQLKDPGIRPLTPAYENVTAAIRSSLWPPSSAGPASVAPLRSSIDNALQSKGILP